MTLLTSSGGKRFHKFFFNNIHQLNSKSVAGFTPAGFFTLRPARQLSTVPALRSRYYSPAASAKQFSRSKGVMKRQVDQEIERIKKLEEKPRKRMSVLQYYKLNAIKRPEFKERIALVLAKITELKGCGLLLTKIRIDEDATSLKIFWSTKSTDGQDKKIISEILKNKHSQFMEQVGKELGEIPQCHFVLDENYNWQNSVNSVLDSIGETLPSEDERKGSIMDQLTNLKLGDDIYKNMSRDAIIKQLTQAQQKESRQLKIDTEQIKQFKEVYDQTILYHGSEDKKKTKYNIRKFLQQRNAMPREN